MIQVKSGSQHRVEGRCTGIGRALTSSLEKLSDENVRINVIHGGTGGITNDVALAATSNAVIIGLTFGRNLQRRAAGASVDIELYRII